MKRAKKISALVLGILYLLLGTVPALALSPVPEFRPYFRAYGADIAAGGWFNSGSSSCSPAASTFRAPTYSPLSNIYKGGVMTYARSNGTGGGSQFGALALGLIEGSSGAGEPYGFTSGSSGYNRLSFANALPASLSVANFWGGFLEGSDAHQASHCLPDYYGTHQPSASVAGSINLNAANGNYYVNSSVTLSGGIQVRANPSTNLAYFVNGNVYINNDITYAGGYTADNVPKFALVVRGNIYVAPSVSRLDGLYIAQPDTTSAATISNSGVVWTCHDGTTNIPSYTYVRDNCGGVHGKLTFNGAVIAKQVAFLRIGGDSAIAGANEPASSGNIAEVFNYTPEMIIGGGFFNGGSKYKVESLISLPPVF
ncbi:MAG: hypothetical protein Q7R60_03185 [bacterium]|nr:hypothetical protein [bacterium]